MSPLYMKDVFIQKEVTYGLRDVNLLVQPKFTTVTYGHNTIKYQRSKLWNNLLNGLKKMNSLLSFKYEILKWCGPECHCGYCLQCSLTRMKVHFFYIYLFNCTYFIIISVKSYFSLCSLLF